MTALRKCSLSLIIDKQLRGFVIPEPFRASKLTKVTRIYLSEPLNLRQLLLLLLLLTLLRAVSDVFNQQAYTFHSGSGH